MAGKLVRVAAVVIGLAAVLLACGKDVGTNITTPGPGSTVVPSKGTAPAPGFATGTTAPPVRTTGTTARSGSTTTSATESTTTTTSESTTTTAAP